ncbi:MAG: hypothetical protein CMJ76_16320 [Planctomycetaceae bacterium]|nr:hypothetical protein [Planctomycetaceae bacterium]
MAIKSKVSTTQRHLWNPIVDFLGLGGLSVFVIIGAVLVFPPTSEWFEPFSNSITTQQGTSVLRPVNMLTAFMLLTIIINHPHFMASYRLLYRSRKQIQTYRWSAIGVPVVLALMSLVVLISGATDQTLLNGDITVGSGLLEAMNIAVMVYLGWHYNMQAWGIICTYLFLGEIRLDPKEKWMIKSGLFVLVGMHALLWIASSPMMVTYQSIAVACVAITPFVPFIVFPFFIAGGLGFYRLAKRTGRRIPLNALVPWLAVYVWYYGVLKYHDIVGITIVVQLAHALQYLVVTTRVEANAAEKKHGLNGIVFTIMMYFMLVALGYVVFELPGIVGMQAKMTTVYKSGLTLLVVSINLHHFFVDGAIWKISNPEVRKDLFAHLETK